MYQVSLFFQCGKSIKEISGVSRSKSLVDAFRQFTGGNDISYAPFGYAHPIDRKSPLPEDYRWNIRCTVTGKLTMDKKPPDDWQESKFNELS